MDEVHLSERRSTALVVDDDTVFRNTMKTALVRRDWEVGVAGSVDEGLRVQREGRWDLILLDHRMPGTKGASALHDFRKRSPDAVIVLLTGFGDVPLAVAAMHDGADSVLCKPMEVDPLLEEVERLRRMKREPGTDAERTAQRFDLDKVEHEAILAALAKTNGVISSAAKILGIDRRTLQRKMRRWE